jgi:hypothetical protein
VISTDLAYYIGNEASTLYRTHWADQKHRTGLPFVIERVEDLFVRSVPPYARCDRYDGVFNHPWNMGEEYRPAMMGRQRLVPLR